MNKKKLIINISILVIIIGITLFYLFKDDGVSKLDSLNNLSVWSLLALLGAIIFIFISEGLIIWIGNIGVSNKLNYFDSVMVYSMGNFGSNISPFKSLHYPALFYCFNKKGLNFEEGLANVTKCSIVYGSATSILYTVLLIICHVNKFTIDVNGITIRIEIATLIGLLVNLFQIAFYLVLAYSHKVHEGFIKMMGAILYKFKRITDKEIYKEEQSLKMRVFREQINYFLTHLKHYFLMNLLYIARVVVFGGLTYFIYLFLTHKAFDFKLFVMFFILYQASAYIANVVPTPGGSGGFEFSFMVVYAQVIEEAYLSTTLIIYRSVTYYIPVIIEAILFSILVFKGKKKVSFEEVKTDNITG